MGSLDAVRLVGHIAVTQDAVGGSRVPPVDVTELANRFALLIQQGKVFAFLLELPAAKRAGFWDIHIALHPAASSDVPVGRNTEAAFSIAIIAGRLIKRASRAAFPGSQPVLAES